MKQYADWLEYHLNRGPTDKLFSHFISLPEVICAEDEGVDDTEESDHVRDVICGLQLVHDHAEAILLLFHDLRRKITVALKAALLQSLYIDSNTRGQCYLMYYSDWWCRTKLDCLVVIQGIKSQAVTISGEHTECCEEFKHLLLHHDVGGVQGCEWSLS